MSEYTIKSWVIPDLPVSQVSTRERISAFGTLISASFSMRGVRRDDARSKYNYYEMDFYDARGVLPEVLN